MFSAHFSRAFMLGAAILCRFESMSNSCLFSCSWAFRMSSAPSNCQHSNYYYHYDYHHHN